MRGEEVALDIDVFKPDTLPMARLAEYLKHFSALLGNETQVHFDRVTEGSAHCVAWVERTAYTKVKERLDQLAVGDAPKAATEAHARIDELLAKDNAVGRVTIAKHNVIDFPGRRSAPHKVIGPVRRNSSIEGQIYSIGGRDETINVYLKDGNRESKCEVSIALARELSRHLWGAKIRIFGQGFWVRVDSEWQMRTFSGEDFVVLRDVPIREELETLSESFQDVSPADLVSTMHELRHG